MWILIFFPQLHLKAIWFKSNWIRSNLFYSILFIFSLLRSGKCLYNGTTQTTISMMMMMWRKLGERWMTMVYVRAIENECFFSQVCSFCCNANRILCSLCVRTYTFTLSHALFSAMLVCVFFSLHHMLVAFVALLLCFFSSLVLICSLSTRAQSFSIFHLLCCVNLFIFLCILCEMLSLLRIIIIALCSFPSFAIHIYSYTISIRMCYDALESLYEKKKNREAEEVKIGKLYQLKKDIEWEKKTQRTRAVLFWSFLLLSLKHSVDLLYCCASLNSIAIFWIFCKTIADLIVACNSWLSERQTHT